MRVRPSRVSRRSLLLSFGDQNPSVISSRRAASIYERRSEGVGSKNLPEDSLYRSRRSESHLAMCFDSVGLLQQQRGSAAHARLTRRHGCAAQFNGDCPDKAQQLARDRRHHHLAFLSPRDELSITTAEPNLSFPRYRLQVFGRGIHAPEHATTNLCRAPIRPGRFDEQAANGEIPSFGDTAHADRFSAGVFSRY